MNAFEKFQESVLEDEQLTQLKGGGDPPPWPEEDDDDEG
jgi:hypothetical protein